MRRRPLLLGGVVFSLGVLLLPMPVTAGVPFDAGDLRSRLAGVPLPFIANQGQIDKRVAYYAPTFAGTLFVTRQGQLIYHLDGPRTDPARDGGRHVSRPGVRLTETLLGGRARPVGQDRSTAGVSTFVGDDPARWRSALPTYEQVGLGEVWPGVSVALRARGRSVEKVFTVHPRGAVARIRVRVAGARALTVDGDGALVASTGPGTITFSAPVAYQERHGVRRPVRVAYRRHGVEYGFSVGTYDPALPLVIDPLLQSTYVGGFALEEAYALAIHPTTGDIYVAGRTRSTNFPGVAGGAQPLFRGDNLDAFVARLPSTLTSLTQATFLGGSEHDTAYAVAVHPSTGDIYVAGDTGSSDFPGTVGGARSTPGGGFSDAFIARLPSTLTSLTQATYLGGNDDERASALAIHPATGDVYVAGTTDSSNFSGTPGGAQPTSGGGFSDAFIARLPSTLTALTQATYLGGSTGDLASALAIHPTTGDVYVAGITDSVNFPGVAGGLQPAVRGGGGDAFVARLPGTLTSLIQATYLGGGGLDSGLALAIHPTTGDVYVAGGTGSGDFPGTEGGAQPALGGGISDVAIARLAGTLTSLIQATYLGGSGDDIARALAIHPVTGDVYVAGVTSSLDFPGTAGGAQPASGGLYDVFVARLPGTLTSLSQVTYLGGDLFDEAVALAIHPTSTDVYVAGTTGRNFPGTALGAQPTYGGSDDAFVARLTFDLTARRNACCGDFDGDGKADILWREATGAVVVWLMNGTSIRSIGLPGSARNDWRIAGVGDFNGDGLADILWRHVPSGTVAVSLMNGTSVGNAGVSGVPGADWTIVGVGDFDGDGKADVLWRHTSGTVSIWFMNGIGIGSSGVAGVVPTDWQVAGVGDFNADGRADILWRQSSGAVAIWLTDGLTLISAGVVGVASPDWQIAGVGDFNGDGKADILWRQSSSGAVVIWLTDGLTLINAGVVGVASADWQIASVGDFDGDGKADILWRQVSSATVTIWLIDGIGISAIGTPGAAASTLQIQ